MVPAYRTQLITFSLFLSWLLFMFMFIVFPNEKKKWLKFNIADWDCQCLTMYCTLHLSRGVKAVHLQSNTLTIHSVPTSYISSDGYLKSAGTCMLNNTHIPHGHVQICRFHTCAESLTPVLLLAPYCATHSRTNTRLKDIRLRWISQTGIVRRWKQQPEWADSICNHGGIGDRTRSYVDLIK